MATQTTTVKYEGYVSSGSFSYPDLIDDGIGERTCVLMPFMTGSTAEIYGVYKIAMEERHAEVDVVRFGKPNSSGGCAIGRKILVFSYPRDAAPTIHCSVRELEDFSAEPEFAGFDAYDHTFLNEASRLAKELSPAEQGVYCAVRSDTSEAQIARLPESVRKVVQMQRRHTQYARSYREAFNPRFDAMKGRLMGRCLDRSDG